MAASSCSLVMLSGGPASQSASRSMPSLALATSALPMWDQPAVHEVYRRWRRVTDDYGIPGEDAEA